MLDVLIVHRAVAEQRPDEVRAIVEGWQRAVSAWRERPAETEKVMAEAMRRSPETLSVDLADLEFFDIDKNRALYSAASGEPQAWRSYRAAVTFMTQHKLIHGALPDAAAVIDPSFLGPAGR